MSVLIMWSTFLIVSLLTNTHSLSLRANQESNEIRDPQLSTIKPLPICHQKSVCAHLQANHRGINVQPLCACVGLHSCRHIWDAMDGHSITQGSDQYKFCEHVTQPNRCNPMDFAYTSLMEFSKETGEMMALATHVHCWCPDHHGYESFDTQFDENDDYEVILSRFTCQQLKTCDPSESCRVVTDSGDTFLVKNLCSCPHHLTCPSNSRHAVESTPMEKGTVKLIRCQ